MSRTVLDSSAVLAYLNAEPGGDAVEAVLPDAAMSTVNLAEVYGKLISRSHSVEAIREIFDILNFEIIDFDRDLAERAGALADRTRAPGLSLGDRACLALAARERVPAVTADRSWTNMDIGAEVRLIR